MTLPVFASSILFTVAVCYMLVNSSLAYSSSELANSNNSILTFDSSLKRALTANVIIARDSSFPDNKNFFVPSNLTIEGNTTVIWTNNDTVLHTVTSGNPKEGPSGIFDSLYLAANQKYNHTFPKIGNYEYFCTLHPFMTGEIAVVKQTKPFITILTPDETPVQLNVTIANGSSFPDNGKFYVPSEVNIGPNGTVTWTNNDTVIHTVTSGKPREGPSGFFDSGFINSSSRFNHTFDKAGVYEYYSTLNPYMVGKIIAGFYSYNLQIDGRIYPVSFLITGDGNQIQKINLQRTGPLIEITMLASSSGNLTLVIPRILLDNLDQNGKDNSFGVIGNRPVAFEEISNTPLSRTLVIQFDKGVNYIQILGSKSVTSLTSVKNETGKSTPVTSVKNETGFYEYENKKIGVKMTLPVKFGVGATDVTLDIYPLVSDTADIINTVGTPHISFTVKKISQPFSEWAQSQVPDVPIQNTSLGYPILVTESIDGKNKIAYVGDEINDKVYVISYPVQSTYPHFVDQAKKIVNSVRSAKEIQVINGNNERSKNSSLVIEPICNGYVTHIYVNTIPCVNPSNYLQHEEKGLGMKVSYPPDWKISSFLSGVILNPPQAGNTSLFISVIEVGDTDLWSFVNSELDGFQKSTTGHFDIQETSMCCEYGLIANNPSVNIHFTYKDSTFKTYVYEHQKTYLKHGNKIYIFDIAADSNKSFQQYLDTTNNIIYSSLFTAPSSSSSDTGDTMSNTAPSSSSSDTGDTLSYENASIGIKLDYPSNFEKMNFGNSIVFHTPLAPTRVYFQKLLEL